MTLDEFVKAFADEFDDTPKEQFTPATNYKGLDEWSSLMALSIISMVDDTFDVGITGADLRKNATIEALYNFIQSKL